MAIHVYVVRGCFLFRRAVAKTLPPRSFFSHLVFMSIVTRSSTLMARLNMRHGPDCHIPSAPLRVTARHELSRALRLPTTLSHAGRQCARSNDLISVHRSHACIHLSMRLVISCLQAATCTPPLTSGRQGFVVWDVLMIIHDRQTRHCWHQKRSPF